jgi:hypothetical protein
MQNIVDKVFPHFAKEEMAADKAMQVWKKKERVRESVCGA